MAKSILEQEHAEEADAAAQGKPRRCCKCFAAPETNLTTRKCTDVPCLFIFVAYLFAMACILQESFKKGNVEKVYRGFDWEGKICGVDHPDAKMLYWCKEAAGFNGGALHGADPSISVTISDGICVSECPSDATQSNKCPSQPIQTRTKVDCTTKPMNKLCEADPSTNEPLEKEKIIMTVTRNFKDTPNVATTPILGMYCLPTAEADMVKEIVNSPVLNSAASRAAVAATSVIKDKNFLIFIGVFCIILCYIYLFCIVKMAKYLILTLMISFWIVLFIGTIVWVGLAALSILRNHCPEGWKDTHPVENPVCPWNDRYTQWKAWNLFGRYVDEGTARVYAIVAGSIFFLAFVGFGLCFKSLCRAITTTCDSMADAVSAIYAMPTLLLQPLIQVALNVSFFAVMLYGLLWIMSMGEIKTTGGDMFSQLDTGAGVGVHPKVSGVARSFTYTQKQYVFLAVWGFGILWIMALISAMGQMAISHGVVSWKLNHHSFMPLCKGYINAVVFHMGTLAFGAFIVGMLQAFTFVCHFVQKQLPKGKDGKDSKVGKAICCCCMCFLKCLEEIVKSVNQMVYVDTVIEGTSYRKSVANVWAMMAKNPVTFVAMAGATKIVKFLGIVAIGGGCTFGAYELAHNPAFVTKVISSASKSLGNYASIDMGGAKAEAEAALMTTGADAVTVACGIICITISASFMHVFDQAAEALLYARLWKGEIGDTSGGDGLNKSGYKKMADEPHF